MTFENDLSRIGISLPKNLLDKFDEIINARGYSSRSEGSATPYAPILRITNGWQMSRENAKA